MTTRKPGFPFRTAVLACCVVLASGCASTPRNPDDPLEGYNRAMFTFNEKVDKAVLKPVAEAYDYVTPKPVKIGVGNFFSNLADPWIGLNNLLQGKPAEALSDWMRFMVNTVFGFAGLLDIASEAQLPKHDEDFGQTLAVWGVGEGPYFVVPFFGPRTVRDAAVLPVDLTGEQAWRADHVPTRNAFRVLDVVHTRSTLLGADRTLEESTFDQYAYLRDFYLQQRRYKVHDGNPPVEYEDFNGAAAPAEPLRLTDAAAVAAIGRLELVDAGAVGSMASAPLPHFE
jgi:phospholipid-binding lipoprotein MlaA